MIFTDPYQLNSVLERMRYRGQLVAICPGCFDVLHAGHAELLRQARTQADLVVVATNTDESIKRTKGPHRPIVPLQQRLVMLDAMRYVAAVISYEEDTPENLCRIMRPDVMVKGEQYFGTDVPGSEFCRRTMFVRMTPGVSTSAIVQQAAGSLQEAGGPAAGLPS